MYIDLNLIVYKKINDERVALRVLDTLEKYDFIMEKIGYYEPMREEYTKDKAMEMWLHEEPGCYDFELDKMIGLAGGFLGRSRKKGMYFSVLWFDCPVEMISNISLSIRKNVYKKHAADIKDLWIELIEHVKPIYAYIGNEESIKRQYIPNRVTERLPGIFWGQYFEKTFVNHIGKEKLKAFQWSEVIEMEEGIGVFLGDNPIDDMTEQEEEAKKYFGVDLFNGKAEDYLNIFK